VPHIYVKKALYTWYKQENILDSVYILIFKTFFNRAIIHA